MVTLVALFLASSHSNVNMQIHRNYTVNSREYKKLSAAGATPQWHDGKLVSHVPVRSFLAP